MVRVSGCIHVIEGAKELTLNFGEIMQHGSERRYQADYPTGTGVDFHVF
jgi:hypothetical protein